MRETPPTPHAFEIGRMLPDWYLESIDGSDVQDVPGVGAFAGKPLLVLFFSLRCPGCTARAIPFANRVVVERGDAVQVVGILTDGSEMTGAEVERETAARHVRFPVYRDAGLAATAHAYRTAGTPHWVLVSPSGVVVDSIFGSEPDRALLRLDYHLMEQESLATVGFGGGCHWCTEAVFESLKGVERVDQGWICSRPPHETWSEAVVVQFRPDVIGLDTLIDIHLLTHSSTSDHAMRRKYRSAVYTFGEAQREAARAVVERLREENGAAYVTEALPFAGFRMNTPDYLHYFQTRPDAPFCQTYIHPKLQTLRRLHSTHVKPPDALSTNTSADAPEQTHADPEVLTWREVIRRVNHGNPPPPRRVEQTASQWRAALPDEVYRVIRIQSGDVSIV